jgi:hypothetical protein
MHAVFSSVTVNDEDTGTARLRDEIVPLISSAPEFVAGYWIRLQGNKGVSLVMFESENAAQAMVDMVRERAQVDDSVILDTMEVGEVRASA